MPYKFHLGDLLIECDSADEVRAIANGYSSAAAKIHPVGKYRRRNPGVSAYWRRVRMYAKRHNVSRAAAMKALSKT